MVLNSGSRVFLLAVACSLSLLCFNPSPAWQINALSVSTVKYAVECGLSMSQLTYSHPGAGQSFKMPRSAAETATPVGRGDSSPALRIQGISHLLLGSADAAAQTLRKAVEISPSDEIARVALGHALYQLRQGESAAVEYRTFVQTDNRTAGRFLLRSPEINRRIREALLLDASRLLMRDPASAVNKLTLAEPEWPNELMRLAMLRAALKKMGQYQSQRHVEALLGFVDFRAFGLEADFERTVDTLVRANVWTTAMARRARLGFEWDSGQSGSPLREVSKTAESGKSSRESANLLPPLEQWISLDFANQTGLIAPAAYKFRILGRNPSEPVGAILCLWQREPAAGEQPARGGFFSPVLKMDRPGRYTLSLCYSTAFGERPGEPTLHLILAGTTAFPMSSRLSSTQGRWETTTMSFELSGEEINSRHQLWIVGNGNGLICFADPALRRNSSTL